MNSLNKACDMYRRAASWGLSNSDLLADPCFARATCNGIGAEWFPPCVRACVTRLHPTLEPAAWIHDVRYYLGGTAAARFCADWEFLRNGFRSARARYSARDPRRYLVLRNALVFFLLLRLFGAPAWGR